MAIAPCLASLPSLSYNIIFSRPREAQPWLHSFSAAFQYGYNSGLSHFSSFQENCLHLPSANSFTISPKMLLTFWLQTSPFHSSSWKSHSIHYLCQAPCAVLAGRLYFEASMRHILNVMLQLSHAEIYFGCLKSDFSGVQDHITSELFNTLFFHLCLLKLGVNVAQGGGENQSNK